MPWFVSYASDTGMLNREGPDSHADESGFTVVKVTPDPVLWDEFTGKRLLEWNAATLEYVPRMFTANESVVNDIRSLEKGGVASANPSKLASWVDLLDGV